MDCILINSPDALFSEHYLADPKVPLGLLYIGAYLRVHGTDPMIIDCHARKYTPEQVAESVKQSQCRIVGLNISTPNRRAVYKIAKAIKEKVCSSTIVVGGPHATCAPYEIFESCPHVDGIVMGEGEQTTLELVRGISADETPTGFYSRASHSNGKNPQLAPRIENLDSLPLPAYDLIELDRYLSVSPELYITCSRGCRYDCAFCCSRSLLGRQVVFRSCQSVINEMSFLRQRYRTSSFYLLDDNILVWPDLEMLCRELITINAETTKRISWTAQAAINDLDVAIAPTLSSAGCYRLSFGFESGSQTVQKYIGKVIKPDAPRKITALSRCSIQTRGFFIVGFPKESVQHMAETAKYLIELRAAGLSDIVVFPARPYPGTRLYDECISIFGEESREELLEYRYLEDYKEEKRPTIRTKLHRYNTIPSSSINLEFSAAEIRRIIMAFYEIFYYHREFTTMSNKDLTEFLLKKARLESESIP